MVSPDISLNNYLYMVERDCLALPVKHYCAQLGKVGEVVSFVVIANPFIRLHRKNMLILLISSLTSYLKIGKIPSVRSDLLSE